MPGPGMVEATSDADLQRIAETGMLVAHWARVRPDAPAVLSSRGNRSYRELNAAANRLARVLREAGLRPGNGIALVCPNTPEFIETLCAAQRAGLRLTPVNWHLTGPEIGYIVENSEAKAVVVHGELGDKVADLPLAATRIALSIGADVDGFDRYETRLAAADDSDIADPVLGSQMLYTSGTTGRPKGVRRHKEVVATPAVARALGDYGDDSVSLLSGPAYHASPIFIDIALPLAAGAPVVMMERFDPEEALRLIERHRVTNAHMVATMFQRLLRLSDAVRTRYDLSSLRVVPHGAAPTPRDVKRAMIDWWGPVLLEYYAATEGGGDIRITSEEWLRKPGSVGRIDRAGTRIFDAEGAECPAGVTGAVHFSRASAGFDYFKAPASSDADSSTFYTVGDMGFVDEDGYLFLTGRTAECIISGGVNIYPAEIDAAFAQHPAVQDVCTIGIPNAEWGEEVRTVVALAPGFAGSAELAADLIDFARPSLASFKLPKTIDFVDSLPRSEAGKIQRQLVRAPYWKGHKASI